MPPASGKYSTFTFEFIYLSPCSFASLSNLIPLSDFKYYSAVWACRAVALQCGNELSELRTCFNEKQGVGHDGAINNVGAILKHNRTAYEIGKKAKSGASSSEDGDEIPCREIQERMGQCISENSKALARRHVKRTSANEESEP